MPNNLIPPFNKASAEAKVQRAEDLWNSKDPSQVALAYTSDSQWRNRTEQFTGRDAIIAFLTRKWQRELKYSLRKQLFAFDNNRIAVNFIYEYHDNSGQWHRAYGLEHWVFDSDGLMQTRETSINEIPIAESDRELI